MKKDFKITIEDLLPKKAQPPTPGESEEETDADVEQEETTDEAQPDVTVVGLADMGAAEEKEEEEDETLTPLQLEGRNHLSMFCIARSTVVFYVAR